MLHPSPTFPTMFSAGMVTSSKKTSQNSASPAILRIGLRVMPDIERSMRTNDRPSRPELPLTDRTSANIQSAWCAHVDHVL
jgi:hypothetical protein